MEKMLMLGSSDGSLEIIEYAKNHRIYIIVTDYDPLEKSPAKQAANEYWMISTADLDTLEKKCREEGITSIITGGAEFSALMQIELCRRLNLPCYCDLETFKYSVDKAAFKEKCKEYSVPIAKGYTLSENPSEGEWLAVEYPVVTKAVDRASNLGMSYCYNELELKLGYEKAKKMSKSGRVVVEKMLLGQEYLSYYVLADGKISLLAFYPKFSASGAPKNCYSINSTIVKEEDLNRYLCEVDPYVRNMLEGIGCRDGVVWLDLMADENGKIHALEMGQRLTGSMIWYPLKDIHGFDSIAWLVNYARGKRNEVAMLPESQKKPYRACACGYVLWSNHAAEVSEILGFDALESVPNFHCTLMVSQGETIDAYRYAAVLTFTAENCSEMCNIIDYINNMVHIYDKNGEDILIRYDNFNQLMQIYQDNFPDILCVKNQ